VLAQAEALQNSNYERAGECAKDEFRASQIRVRGAAKVMAHLMFGVLLLTVDQWLRIAPPLAN